MNEFQQNTSQDSIDIKKYIFKILSNWYWFVLAVGLSVTIAWLINRYTEPVYTVTTTLMISDNANTMQGIESLIEELGLFRRRRRTDILNEIEILKSYQLSYNTIKELEEFKITYVAVGDIKDAQLYRSSPFRAYVDTTKSFRYGYPVHITILNANEYEVFLNDGYDYREKVTFGEWFRHPSFNFKLELRNDQIANQFAGNNPGSIRKYYFVVSDLFSLSNRYRNKMNISLTNDRGRTVMIRTNGKNIDREVDFLNKLGEVYIQTELEEKNQIAEQAMNFIDEQLNVMADSLAKEELKLQKFRQENALIDISKQSEEYYEKLKTLQEEKVDLIVLNNYFEHLLGYLDDFDVQDPEVIPIIPTLTSNIINNKINEFNDLILDLSKMTYGSTRLSPEVRAMRASLAENIAILEETIQKNYEFNNQRISEIDGKMALVEEDLKDVPAKERAYLNIQRKYTLNDNLYTFLLEKRAEAGIAKASNVAGNQVLDEARAQSAYKISPKSRNNYTMALLLGFGIPLGFIFLLDFFNNKINSREDVEKRTSLPIIGTIGHNHRETNVPVLDHPKSVIAENFRALRTNLQYVTTSNKSNIILVTSTISGEGKTFCSINLAAILAASNNKTLLVSLDLRKPKIHKFFGLENEVGLSTYLINKTSLEDAIIHTGFDNLHIATAGPIPPNPAELLETPEMAGFFQEVRKQFDFIIVDTPPLAIVSDALHIAHFVDTNLFVIRQKYSNREVLRLVNEMNETKKMKHINLIINDISKPRGYGYNYSYGYDYGYGYGYGYGYNEGYYEEEAGGKRKFLGKLLKRFNNTHS